MTKGTVWLMSIALSMALLASGWAQQTSPLAGEEALRKAVTVQSKMILVPDLLREVGKQTGVALTCGRELANDKLTVFVREKPAAELLAHVATILTAEWRKTKSGYMLVQTEQARRWEEEFFAAQREQGWKQARQHIQELMEASLQDYAVLVERTMQRRENLYRRPEGEKGNADSASMTIPVEPPVIGAELHEYLIGWLFRRFSRTLWTQLEQGEVVFASTFPMPGAMQLPSEAIGWARESAKLRLPIIRNEYSRSYEEFVLSEENMPTDLLLVLSARQVNGELQYALVQKMPRGISMERMVMPTVSLYEPPVETALAAHWRQWQTAGDARLLLLDTPVHAQREEEKSPYPNSAYLPHIPFTLADLAEQLSKRAEVNIVADAYRVFWYTGAPDVVKREQHTLREWLRGVFRMKEQAGWWRVEGDTLLMKHASYPLYRRTELPESTVRELERKAQEGRPLTLDDYAKLASTFTSLHELRNYAVRFDIQPLIHQYPHLQFWAALNPVQRANLLRSGLLTPDMLSAPQQRTFWQSAWRGMLSSHYHGFESPEEPNDLPIPRLELSTDAGEQYEIVSARMRFTGNDLNRVREFARQQFTQGALDADYQIKGYRAETYTLRYFLYPGVRYSTQIVLRREIPLPQEQSR